MGRKGQEYAGAKHFERLLTDEVIKWGFLPPGGESYAQLLVRVREWHDSVSGDAVVTAHGGVARAFLVLYGVKSPAEAPLGDIAQGVVYEFMPGSVKRYG